MSMNKTNQTAINSHLTSLSGDNEYDALLALLRAQPRVAAPTDFDFKLRARIARAESAQAENQAGWLASFWAKSFRPSQALAGLAAIALFVVAATLFINRNGQTTPQGGERIAAVQATGTALSSPAPASVPSNPGVVPAQATRVERELPKVAVARATTVSFKPKAASAVMASVPQREQIALAETASSFYLRDKGQMGRISNRPVSIGAEDAMVARPQTVALSF